MGRGCVFSSASGGSRRELRLSPEKFGVSLTRLFIIRGQIPIDIGSAVKVIALELPSRKVQFGFAFGRGFTTDALPEAIL